MKKIFSLAVALITAMLSISLLPPPLTSDARAVTSVTISTIRNSCIVNNTNIAVQNANNTPLDAINNWWGMPTGATHDNIPSGDAVGQRVLHAPYLPTMPFLCDLSDADWIPFSEQDLQNAINNHIPHLGGIAFALIDFEWGSGAKFDILTHPNYGNRHDVAYITIKPNPTGDLITLQLDLTRLPTDETVRQIVTCELVPLFVNSLQQVQNRYVSPSQNITSMVVIERDLMMRFSPPTQITPEPAPEIVMNYDASCLPPLTPPETIIESGNGENENWVTTPPLEGEFLELESLQQQTPCVGDWCRLLTQVGDIFTYTVYFNQQPYVRLFSVQRTDSGIVGPYEHILPPYITYPSNPSWGVVGYNHHRLAFNCIYQSQNAICYWDSKTNQFYTSIDAENISSRVQISPDGRKIIAITNNGTMMKVWDLLYNVFLRVPVSDNYFFSVEWSSNNIVYYPSSSSGVMLRLDLSNLTTNLILDGPFDPRIYDVSDDNLLFWSELLNQFDLIYRGLGIIDSVNNSLDKYPIHWSPHSDNRVIRLLPDPNNISQNCLSVFQVSDINTADTIACFNINNSGFTWANLNITIEQQIAELAEYGITAYPNGLPSSAPAGMSWSLGQNIPWAVEELDQILIGVKKTAKAFYMLKNNIYANSDMAQLLTGDSDAEKQIFRSVMDSSDVNINGFFLLRVTDDFKFGPLEAQGCDAFIARPRNHGCTSNTYSSIAFYGNFWQVNPNGILNVEYNLVHELGHRFDNQSDTVTQANTKLSDAYVDGNGTIVIEDCNQQRVMGTVPGRTDWARGARGWGDVSSPNTFGNTFQQNVTEIIDGTGAVEESGEVDEAAADMFLNWVYRRITDRWSNPSIDGLRCALPSFPEGYWNPTEISVDNAWRQLDSQWQGFRNIAPDYMNSFNYGTTIYDFDLDLNPDITRGGLSGNARYWWMENTMKIIFELHPNWN